MRVVAIINPISGGRRLDALTSDVGQRLASRGIKLAVRATTGPGHATLIARSLDPGARAVLSVGGDGTLREVAEGLVGSQTPIVVVPSGTENVIAQELGARATASRVVETVVRGRSRAVDVGSANGRCFLIVAGVGFDGAVARRLAAERSGHISHLNYLGPMLKAAWSYRFPPIRVVVDDEVVFEDRGVAFVGVMSRYSVGLRVVRDAVWDDGILDVCILRCGHVGRLCVHAMRVALRCHVESKHTVYCRGQRVTITSRDQVPVEIGGEAAGVLPLDLMVRRRAVRLMIPPGRRVLGFAN